MTETPLIWTSRGNVPADSLEYRHQWTDTEEEVMFQEFWFAKDNGELVKNNCHKLAKKQLTMGGAQAAMA